MCETAIIHRVGGNLVCETLGDLRAALPGCVVMYFGAPPQSAQDCLCHVDFWATAEKAGIRVEQPFTSPRRWGWVFRDA